jgi:hypothetical protein
VLQPVLGPALEQMYSVTHRTLYTYSTHHLQLRCNTHKNAFSTSLYANASHSMWQAHNYRSDTDFMRRKYKAM